MFPFTALSIQAMVHANRYRRGRPWIVALFAAPLLSLPAIDTVPSAFAQTPPSGQQLIRRMEQAALARGTFHERIEFTASATYSQYGAPVRVSLPATCRLHASPAAASRTVTARLHPVGSAKVRGRAILTAAGGETRAFLDVRGLPPGSRATALIHYGVCSDLAHLSASAASLPNLRANARGEARASGRVLTEMARQNVALSVLADGHHAIVIVLPRRGLVACGTIP